MSNSTTFGIGGKYGRLQLFGTTQDLRLTKWGFHAKSDKIPITNTRSPAIVLGKTNFTTQIFAEFINSILVGELTWEGIYTILDATGPTYNNLLSLSSGTPGMIPGTGDADSYGRASVILTPDDVRYAANTLTGSVVIETFDVDGEIEGGVTFKGSGTFSGAFAVASANPL